MDTGWPLPLHVRQEPSRWKSGPGTRSVQINKGPGSHMVLVGGYKHRGSHRRRARGPRSCPHRLGPRAEHSPLWASESSRGPSHSDSIPPPGGEVSSSRVAWPVHAGVAWVALSCWGPYSGGPAAAIAHCHELGGLQQQTVIGSQPWTPGV